MNENTIEGIVLSGMRPTGALHIGHIEGVVRSWEELQKHNKCYFFVADWHAMTSNTDTKDIAPNSVAMVKDWIAAGIDPEKSTLFVQSQVPQHAQLSTVLSMLTTLGRLERLPTFHEYMKEVVGADTTSYNEKKRSGISLGMLGYPVLQAADILLYNTTHIPVGEDQLPHVELTRELARRFNHLYGETFTVPEAVLGNAPRIIGADGRKMSKSYNNVVNPQHTGEQISSSIKKMMTDPNKRRKYDPGNPYVCTVWGLHNIYTDTAARIAQECESGARGCVPCKEELATNVEDTYRAFVERRSSLSDDYVIEALHEGSKDAQTVAESTMLRVRTALGTL